MEHQNFAKIMDQSPSRTIASDVQQDHFTAPLQHQDNDNVVATKSHGDVANLELERNPEIESPSTDSCQEDNSNVPPTNTPTGEKDVSLAKSASTTAAKSKIPSIKRTPNSCCLPVKNKNSPPAPPTQQSTQRTESKRPWSNKNSIVEKKVEDSISKTSLATTRSNVNSARGSLQNFHRAPETKTPKRRTSNIFSRPVTPTKKEGTETNLRKQASMAGDQNKINCLEKHLINSQTEFLTKVEILKQNTSPDKWKNEYKLIGLVCNDECKLLVKDDYLRKMPQKLPVNSVNDFKEKIKTYMDNYWATLKNLQSPDSEVSTPDSLQEIPDLNYETVMDAIDDMCNSYKDDGNDQQIVNMQKDLQEYKKDLKTANTKLAELSKKHEEQLSSLENDLKSKALEEHSRKDAHIKDLQKKLKLCEKQITAIQTIEKENQTENKKLQEELKAVRESFNVIQKKFHTAEQANKTLESEIEVMRVKVKELQEVKQTAENTLAEFAQQISELRIAIQNLETEKSVLEKANQELISETSSNMDLLQKLQDAETQIESLQQQLTASEKLRESQPECPKEVQMELAKLRQSEAEKRLEVETLKVELKKSVFNISQLEEQIQRDQQLLEVRSELINSLQTNETSQRVRMQELFIQVGEKNSAINELNNELSAKSEEFRNLFATISNKQLELSNQEHMIKLLEESNERSQMLRVKQEEKIGRMEEDIAHLKQTIAIYQANALSANGKFVFAPVMPRSHDDCNENFYYYTSQRKRKRQIDINVKKYET